MAMQKKQDVRKRIKSSISNILCGCCALLHQHYYYLFFKTSFVGFRFNNGYSILSCFTTTLPSSISSLKRPSGPPTVPSENRVVTIELLSSMQLPHNGAAGEYWKIYCNPIQQLLFMSLSACAHFISQTLHNPFPCPQAKDYTILVA